MNKIQNIFSISEKSTIADYLNFYRLFQSELNKGTLTSEVSVKIAILSDSTLRNLKEIFVIKCGALGILAEIYIGEYNQYQQEILKEDSPLYLFKPDLLILFVDIRSILGDLFFLPYQQTLTQRQEKVSQSLHELLDFVNIFKSRTKARVLIHNFEVPIYSPLGIQESKQPYGYIEAIEDLNRGLREACKTDPRIYIFNYDAYCSQIGKKFINDPKMYYLADIKLSLQNYPSLCDAYMAYIKAQIGKTKKCIVLDLDRTLWGGIIGEDGLEGIKLGPSPEGRPYWEFQKCLLALFKRGILLAINSHNNPEEALRVLRDHPYCVLREEHFASIQINWENKIVKMKAIANDINIGVESLVFIDDDPLQREIIKKGLPEILVVDLPEDAALYVNTLQKLDDFNTLQLTDEDLKRGQFYAARRNVELSNKNPIQLVDYLKELKMVLKIEKANSFSIPRLAQLTQKTNQFNMTTRRYTEEEIQRIAKNDKYLVMSVSVEDKFGDQGIVGVIIIEKNKENKRWRLDTFLLSCRIIGRQIEESLLAFILKQMREAKVPILLGEFIPTKRNQPAQEFFNKNGFTLIQKDNDLQVWSYNTEIIFNAAEYIKIIS